MLVIASAAIALCAGLAPSAYAGSKHHSQAKREAAAKGQIAVGERESLTTAVEAAEPSTTGDDLLVTIRPIPRRAPAISPLPSPGVAANGAVLAGVGVNAGSLPSSNRMGNH